MNNLDRERIRHRGELVGIPERDLDRVVDALFDHVLQTFTTSELQELQTDHPRLVSFLREAARDLCD